MSSMVLLSKYIDLLILYPSAEPERSTPVHKQAAPIGANVLGPPGLHLDGIELSNRLHISPQLDLGKLCHIILLSFCPPPLLVLDNGLALCFRS